MMPNSISRRGLIGTMGTSAVATSLFDQGVAARVRPSPKTNIIYIHSHDSGRFLAPYGANVPTPRIASLAREGVVFRQMHCMSPSCSPSRAAMLTGQSAHGSGMLGLAHRGWALAHPERHLVHTLRAAGYHTVLSGLQHVAVDADTIGYDTILSNSSDLAKDVAPVAAAFLRSAAARQAPFFLDVGFFETHREFPRPVDDPDHVQPPPSIADTPETRLDMAGFHASARALDDGVGRVLDALEQSGLAENTLVISTTDHGIAFPTMKANLSDLGTGVSMILRGPGAFATHQSCDALLSQIDVFPTLCKYLGIVAPPWLEGTSFLPIIEGRATAVNDEIFTELNFHAAYEPMRAVRTMEYKYMRRFDGRTRAVVVNCDNGITKTLWLKKGWQQQPLRTSAAGEELYDLILDPLERTNLAQRSDMQATIADARRRLADWMKMTNDPLLTGPIPVPPGVRTDDPDALGPTAAPRTH